MRCSRSKNKRPCFGGAASYERDSAQSPFFIPPNSVFEKQANIAAESIIPHPKKSFFSPNLFAAVSPVAVQRKENNASQPVHDPGIYHSITSAGAPMDRSTKEFMELRFGYNFDEVRIHNDSLAHRSADAINARAYTHRNHIVFGNGEYEPKRDVGKRLLAHELIHTIQQKNSQSTRTNPGVRTIQRKDKAESVQTIEEIPKELPCTPTALSRQAFVKATKTTDFGLTKISVSQADLLSSPYVQFKKAGRGVIMEPLTLNMPVIKSNYVQSSQFIEGQTKNKISSKTCPLDFYPINWNITRTGAANLEEAEQEHCNDYNYAFSHSVYPFLVEVNKAAIAGKKFSSTTEADRYLKKKLGFDPHDWFNRFTCMLGNSTIRDYPQNGALRSWHEPEPITQALPNAKNFCNHITLAIMPSSFSGLNNLHPTNVIIPTGCK